MPVVNAYGEVNERATDDRALGGGRGDGGEEVRGMPGQPDCGPARHHALTHEIFKISDTREGRQAQGSTNSNPSPSSSSCVVPFRLDAKLSYRPDVYFK